MRFVLSLGLALFAAPLLSQACPSPGLRDAIVHRIVGDAEDEPQAKGNDSSELEQESYYRGLVDGRRCAAFTESFMLGSATGIFMPVFSIPIWMFVPSGEKPGHTPCGLDEPAYSRGYQEASRGKQRKIGALASFSTTGCLLLYWVFFLLPQSGG